MITFHHVSIACPVCGEVQVVSVADMAQAVLCGDCGIGGIVNFHGNAESRKMVIMAALQADAAWINTIIIDGKGLAFSGDHSEME